MKIIKNSIECRKCGDVITSEHRHDFKWCSCESVAVDGGTNYLRRCGEYSDCIERSEVLYEQGFPGQCIDSSSEDVVCCMCGRSDGVVETTAAGTNIHRRCLEGAALGKLAGELLPNAEVSGGRSTSAGLTGSACHRCASPLEGGVCTDETCPFSDHVQTCERGWIGHPDHTANEDTPCTCAPNAHLSGEERRTEDDVN